MSEPPRRRCVCGQSSTFPICDYSHKAEGWQCASQPGQVAPWCIVAGPHNTTLAEKLAAELSGVAAHAATDRVVASRSVILTEGTDLDAVTLLASRVVSTNQLVIAMNVAPEIVAGVFPKAALHSVAGESTFELWNQIRTACDKGSRTSIHQSHRLRSAFVSHAVQDEEVIHRSIEYLRRFYQADIFSCADSIQSGTAWQNEIVANLRDRDLFVLILTEASFRSTFCAFELGYAMSLGKPIAQISLGGVRPPAFAQHLQMSEVDRLRQRKPWLDSEEALLESLLHILS